MMPIREPGKQAIELLFEALRIAERAAVLEQANGSALAGPVIYILKQVAVNGLEVRYVKVTPWKWFF